MLAWALRNPAKTLADLLTLSRFVIAVVIIGLGWFFGEEGLQAVIGWTLLAWVTDVLDGRLARRSGVKNRISDLDFPVDLALTCAGLIYLVLAGLVSLRFALLYCMVALGSIAFFRKRAVTQLFMTPLYALQILIAFSRARRMAYLYLLYICAVLVVNWKRFTQLVEEFIEGMREAFARF